MVDAMHDSSMVSPRRKARTSNTFSEKRSPPSSREKLVARSLSSAIEYKTSKSDIEDVWDVGAKFIARVRQFS